MSNEEQLKQRIAELEKERDEAYDRGRQLIEGCWLDIEAQRDEFRALLLEVRYLLFICKIGSCSCITKSPNPEYHEDDCLYKKIERMDAKINSAGI